MEFLVYPLSHFQETDIADSILTGDFQTTMTLSLHCLSSYRVRPCHCVFFLTMFFSIPAAAALHTGSGIFLIIELIFDNPDIHPITSTQQLLPEHENPILFFQDIPIRFEPSLLSRQPILSTHRVLALSPNSHQWEQAQMQVSVTIQNWQESRSHPIPFLITPGAHNFFYLGPQMYLPDIQHDGYIEVTLTVRDATGNSPHSLNFSLLSPQPVQYCGLNSFGQFILQTRSGQINFSLDHSQTSVDIPSSDFKEGGIFGRLNTLNGINFSHPHILIHLPPFLPDQAVSGKVMVAADERYYSEVDAEYTWHSYTASELSEPEAVREPEPALATAPDTGTEPAPRQTVITVEATDEPETAGPAPRSYADVLRESVQRRALINPQNRPKTTPPPVKSGKQKSQGRRQKPPGKSSAQRSEKIRSEKAAILQEETQETQNPESVNSSQHNDMPEPDTHPADEQKPAKKRNKNKSKEHLLYTSEATLPEYPAKPAVKKAVDPAKKTGVKPKKNGQPKKQKKPTPQKIVPAPEEKNHPKIDWVLSG